MLLTHFLQAPNHSSIHTPQNAAWLSAINNAQHSILIQTPNMNAEPLLDPLLNAVRRGVVVSCYLCLGYNDAGELLPFQNGTNEMIANRLYNSLETDEKKSRLRVCYYVGKDQTRPIHNSFKKRSCHIKLMIVDEQIAIQGKSLRKSTTREEGFCTQVSKISNKSLQAMETSTRSHSSTVRKSMSLLIPRSFVVLGRS